MEEKIKELKNILKEKKELIISQNYEKASILRSKERRIISDIFSQGENSYIKEYNNYLQEKLKEYENLSKDRKSKEASELLDYVLKNNPKLFNKASHFQCESWIRLKNKDKIFSSDNKEDTYFLNRWIFFKYYII